MYKRIISLIALAGVISACAPNISPNVYNRSEVGTVSHVKKGVVISRRLIHINNESGVGGLAGTTAGAAAGSMAGNNSATNVVGAIGGAVVGGLLGSAIDKNMNHHQGYEYIIRLEGGRIISVTQSTDVRLARNQPVLVIYGPITRLIPDKSAIKA